MSNQTELLTFQTLDVSKSSLILIQTTQHLVKTDLLRCGSNLLLGLDVSEGIL